MINNSQHPRAGPPNAGIPSPTVKRVMVAGSIVGHSSNDRMAGRERHPSAHPPCLTGFNRGLPAGYPIFHPFVQGESRQLCAESSSIRHTLRERESSMRLISLIISRVEPRALSAGNVHGGSTHGWYGRRTGYTQGGTGWYIPGWYTSP